jgi:hypothetical protein
MASYIPDFPYLGDHIIINSGRVTLNSKDDSVFLFAKKAIGFSSAGVINFDCNDTLTINAPLIHLGLETDINKLQHAIKGDNLVYLLSRLLASLQDLGVGLGYATDSNGVAIPFIAAAGDNIQGDATDLLTLLNKNDYIKSNKTFLL